MQRATLTKLALGVFALVFVSFVIRGFGQFVVGPRTATLLGGPLALLAAILLVVVLGLWLLGRVGIIAIEAEGSREDLE